MTKTVWKKLLAAVLVCTLMVGCVAGNGGSTTTGDSTTTTVPTTTTAAPTTTKTTTTTTKKVTTTTQPPAARTVDLMESVTASGASGKEPDDAFIKAQMDWSLELFQKSVMASKNENVLISPLSVQLALAMTANGASGQTRQEMETVLGRGVGLSELNGYLKQYADRLQSAESHPLKLANSIWIRDGQKYAVKPSFLQTNAAYYQAQAYKAAFDKQTLENINAWVKENTDGKIERVLDSIDPLAVMYLLNAVSFEDEWASGYRTSMKESFTNISGEERTVQMMSKTGSLYYDDGKAVGFKLPFKKANCSFVALLPSEGIDFYAYIDGLTAEGMQSALSTMYEADYVYTKLPKFKYDYELEMSDALKQMGMPTAFSTKADFFDMGYPLGETNISKVIHKTTITIDEVGAKAGAVTAIIPTGVGVPLVKPDPTVVEIYLNRPFVYMIIDNTTNLPIFIGAVTDIGN